MGGEPDYAWVLLGKKPPETPPAAPAAPPAPAAPLALHAAPWDACRSSSAGSRRNSIAPMQSGRQGGKETTLPMAVEKAGSAAGPLLVVRPAVRLVELTSVLYDA